MATKLTYEGTDLFVVVDGVKIAKRGHPETPEAGTWIPLSPGWTVLDDDSEIVVTHDGTVMH
jgi:hypothetical protein